LERMKGEVKKSKNNEEINGIKYSISFVKK
jgi:hypothetical protein